MRLEIKSLDIPNIKANEVTSHKIFQDRKMVDKEGNLLFHEDGIFSKKIFGKFGRCTCGKKKHGFCKECNTRVIDKKNIPTFFIHFDHMIIPHFVVKSKHQDILNYTAFYYEGEVCPFNLDEIHLYDLSKVKIGEEALKELGYSIEWIEKNTTDKIVIPHTSMRPILENPSGEQVLGDLNTLFIDLLKMKNKLTKYLQLEEQNIFFELSIKQKMMESITKIRNELVTILTEGKKSVVAKELRGQKIVGAIRAVTINNYSISEDYVVIGKYFLPHLFPKLAEEYQTESGYDIDKINEVLKDYLVLVNRQPTISALSLNAFIPQFSKKDIEQFIIQLNPIVTEGFNLDFDGDVLGVYALYTKNAMKEARKLMVKNNYMDISNHQVKQAMPEDFVYAKGRYYGDY